MAKPKVLGERTIVNIRLEDAKVLDSLKVWVSEPRWAVISRAVQCLKNEKENTDRIMAERGIKSPPEKDPSL